MNDFITVLIPSYNPTEMLLKACLESCLFQSYPSTKYEVLLCFDGPPSDSINELLNTYHSFPNFRSLATSNHVGLKNILNFGISHAKGRYIARLDSDDVMSYERLQIQYNYLKEHPYATCVGSDVFLIDEDFKPLGIKKYPNSPLSINIIGCFRNPLAHPTVMYDLHKLPIPAPYILDSPYEDYALWSTMSASLSNLPVPLTYYRKHSSQISSSTRLRYRIILFIRLKFLRYFFSRKRPFLFPLGIILGILIFVPHPRSLFFK